MNKFEYMSTIWNETEGHPPYCELVDGQPLLLSLDDKGILVSDLYNVSIGHLVENVAKVRVKIESGAVLLARVKGRCLCLFRLVFIWQDGTMETDQKQQKKELV